MALSKVKSEKFCPSLTSNIDLLFVQFAGQNLTLDFADSALLASLCSTNPGIIPKQATHTSINSCNQSPERTTTVP